MAKAPTPPALAGGVQYVSQENPLRLTSDDIDILLQGLPGITEMDFLRFIRTCELTGLNPVVRQIYGRMQNEKADGESSGKKVLVIITGIDGLRSVAERSGQYRGQTAPAWYGKGDNGTYGWHDVFVPSRDGKGNPITLPEAARVGVLREGFPEPVYGVANFSSFSQGYKSRAPGEGYVLNAFWKKMPEHMIAKVAEAQAFRKAFPQVLAGIYIEEEVGAEEAETPTSPTSEKPEEPKATVPTPQPTAKAPEEPAKAKEAPAPPKPKAEPAPKPQEPAAQPAATPETEKPAAPAKRPPAPAQEPAKPEAPTEEPDPLGGAEPEPAQGGQNPDLDYVLKTINHAHFKGRKLGDMTIEELTRLRTGWIEKFKHLIDGDPNATPPTAADPAKIEDRRAILSVLTLRETEV